MVWRELLLLTLVVRAEEQFKGMHGVIGTGGTVQRVFRPSNFPGEARRIQDTSFETGIAELQQAIRTAQQDDKRIRAHGSKWSYSDINYEIGLEHLTPSYEEISDRLVFCQAGVIMSELSEALFQRGLAVSTSGSADGQRVVGAMSTGTHGARVNYGGMAEYVRGLHIVLPSEHVFVQPASDMVVLNAFAEDYLQGARLINDDDLFRAVLVGAGSFGLIHGVVLEAERLYQLRKYSKKLHYSTVKQYITSLENIQSLGIAGLSSQPLHVEIVLNPYKLSGFFEGAYVILMDYVPLTEQQIQGVLSERARSRSWRSTTVNNDIIGLIRSQLTSNPWFMGALRMWFLLPLSTFVSFVKRFIFGIAMGFILDMYADLKGPQPLVDFPHSLFSYSGVNPANLVDFVSDAETEVSVPLVHLEATIETIVDILKNQPIPAPLGIRFVKKSRALLSSQQFDVSATIAMPSIQDSWLFADTFQVFVRIHDALKDHNIPHVFHLGKQCPQHDRWAIDGFGENLKLWKRKRMEFLAENATMFCNAHASIVGLCDL